MDILRRPVGLVVVLDETCMHVRLHRSQRSGPPRVRTQLKMPFLNLPVLLTLLALCACDMGLGSEKSDTDEVPGHIEACNELQACIQEGRLADLRKVLKSEPFHEPHAYIYSFTTAMAELRLMMHRDPLSAEPLYKYLIATSDRDHGSHHILTLRLKSRLALCRSNLGRSGQAADLLEDIVRSSPQEVLPVPELCVALVVTAASQLNEGKAARAKDLYLMNVAVLDSSGDSGSLVEMGSSLAYAAAAAQVLGQIKEAEELVARAESCLEQSTDKTGNVLAFALFGISCVHEKMCRFDTAEEYLIKAENVFESETGPDSQEKALLLESRCR